MRARKLLVVSDEMEVGGSQRQITYLLGGLDRRQWQPELVIFRKESFLVRDMRAQGIVVHDVPKRGRLDPHFVLAYAALLRRERYDLVHAFSLTAELWTLVAGWLAGHRPPLLASIRGLYLDESELFWRIKRFILSRSAAVIANARAGAAAIRAVLARGEADGLLAAERGLFEGDLQRVPEIAPGGATRPLAEQVAENALDHVAHGALEVEPRRRRSSCRTEGRVAETIVGRPLVRIRQHGVGLVQLLERLLGRPVTRVLIGVELERQASVGLLQLRVIRSARHTEHLVVVALRAREIDVHLAVVDHRPRRVLEGRDSQDAQRNAVEVVKQDVRHGSPPLSLRTASTFLACPARQPTGSTRNSGRQWRSTV